MGDWKKYPLAPEVKEEIRRFQVEIDALEAGKGDPDHFKKFRLNNGIYGIRFKDDMHMIRIKIKYGIMTADQLDAVAYAAEKLTPTKVAHVTTRQAIQLHNIKRTDIPELLTIINEAGLTSREACGNTVRNVTASPYAGVAKGEPFDYLPYADAITENFLRNPICQNLPRKFKIAFEGTPGRDDARVGIHDIGFIAKTREVDGKIEKGFEVYVGGGLGGQPFEAQLLEEFMPADLIFATTEAVIRIFDRHGNRKNKNLARIKFVVKNWGIEEFRKIFIAERKAVLAIQSGLVKWEVTRPEESQPELAAFKELPGVVPPGFDQWKETNAIAQKQDGFYTVFVRCPLGDLTHEQMHDVANLSRDYAGGGLRTTITQNVVLNWVTEQALAEVFKGLVKTGLAESGAELLPDITRCPGTDTCQLAITRSKGLAEELSPLFSNGLGSDPELKDISIKISGCPNSCGQHHIADIGFYGNSRTVDGKQVPHYRLLLGGGTKSGAAWFGQAVMQIPVHAVKPAVDKLLNFYKSDKQASEKFGDFVSRTGLDKIKEELNEFTAIPSFEENPAYYHDLGAEGEEALYKVQVGPGECAS